MVTERRPNVERNQSISSIREVRQERDDLRQQSAARRESALDPLLNFVGSKHGSEGLDHAANEKKRLAIVLHEESYAERALHDGSRSYVRALDSAQPTQEEILSEIIPMTDAVLTRLPAQDKSVDAMATAIDEQQPVIHATMKTKAGFKAVSEKLSAVLQSEWYRFLDEESKKSNSVLNAAKLTTLRRPARSHGRLTEALLHVTEGNIQSLKAAWQLKDKETNRSVRQLTLQLLQMGDPIQKRLANAVIKQYLHEFQNSNADDMFYVTELFDYADAEVCAELEKNIYQKLDSKTYAPRQVASLLSSLFSFSDINPVLGQIADRIMNHIISACGLDNTQLRQIWDESKAVSDTAATLFPQNVAALYELEQKSPGAAGIIRKSTGRSFN